MANVEWPFAFGGHGSRTSHFASPAGSEIPLTIERGESMIRRLVSIIVGAIKPRLPGVATCNWNGDAVGILSECLFV